MSATLWIYSVNKGDFQPDEIMPVVRRTGRTCCLCSQKQLLKMGSSSWNNHREARSVARGDARGANLSKCVGQNLKLLDIVQKTRAPLRKLFASPGVPSCLRACVKP